MNRHKKIVGADVALRDEQKFNTLFELVKKEGAHLYLAAKKNKKDAFCVVNYCESRGYDESVTFCPYVDVAHDFPVLKKNCDYWIDRIEDMTSGTQLHSLEKTKRVLFATMFHPEKHEGNSVGMRFWLEQFERRGYQVHLLYYMYDVGDVTAAMRKRAKERYYAVHEIPVKSRLVGYNTNLRNVHHDDWCGVEVIEKVKQLVAAYSFDICLTNYTFFTSIFEYLPAYTERILFTHDKFANRNKRMVEQGYDESGWMSLTEEGEKAACCRAHSIIAVQDDEAAYFSKLVPASIPVYAVPSLPEMQYLSVSDQFPIVIGYIGSHNYINEQNLSEFLEELAKKEELLDRVHVIIAGGTSDFIQDFCPKHILDTVPHTLLGRVDSLCSFFQQCSVVINPERGGTGIKIKSLDTLSFGVPLVCTKAGAVGLESKSSFHHAESFSELVVKIDELVQQPNLIKELANESRSLFDALKVKYSKRVDQVFGSNEQLAVAVSNDSGQCITNSSANQVEQEANARAGEPLISVIIPCYNVEEYVSECVESVLRQLYRNIEVILVNDASTDETPALLKKIAQDNSKCILIEHVYNLGLGPARNSGVEVAKGDYIFFLDSDDYLASDTVLGELVSEMEMKQVDVLVASSQRKLPSGILEDIDADKGASTSVYLEQMHVGREAMLGALCVPEYPSIPLRAWGTLFSRKKYKQAGVEFPPGVHEDMPCIPFLYGSVDKIFYSSTVAVIYRIRPGSLSLSVWGASYCSGLGLLFSKLYWNLKQYDALDYASEIALQFVEHALYRISENALEREAIVGLFESLTSIFSYLDAPISQAVFDRVYPNIRSLFLLAPSKEHFVRMIEQLPIANILKYYGNVPSSAPRSNPPRVMDVVSSNHDLLKNYFAAYSQLCSTEVQNYPAMATDSDKCAYFYFASQLTGGGEIVDIGCFVGGTTVALIEGLNHNPRKIDKKIKSYGLVTTGAGDIKQWLMNRYGFDQIEGNDSCYKMFTQDLIELFHTPELDQFEILESDIYQAKYDSDSPIEFLGIDCCRDVRATDHIIRNFFQYLIPDVSIVAHKNYIDPWHPYVQISMELLQDFFEPVVEFDGGGTFAWRCVKQITLEDIEYIFGLPSASVEETSWFTDYMRNSILLEKKQKSMLYETNRAVLGFAHAVYLKQVDQIDFCHQVVQSTMRMYPTFYVQDELREFVLE